MAHVHFSHLPGRPASGGLILLDSVTAAGGEGGFLLCLAVWHGPHQPWVPDPTRWISEFEVDTRLIPGVSGELNRQAVRYALRRAPRTPVSCVIIIIIIIIKMHFDS